MKRIVILLTPMIIVFVSFFVIMPILSFLGVLVYIIPYIIAVVFIKKVNSNDDNIWILPLSFLISGFLTVICLYLFDKSNGVGQGMLGYSFLAVMCAIFYMIPFFLITLIMSAAKHDRLNK